MLMQTQEDLSRVAVVAARSKMLVKDVAREAFELGLSILEDDPTLTMGDPLDPTDMGQKVLLAGKKVVITGSEG